MVEFNSHASGAADPDYTPICAAAGARGCRYAVLSFLAAPTRGHLARPCVGMDGFVSSRVSMIAGSMAPTAAHCEIAHRSPLPSEPALHAPFSSA
jgi:hypothetical protein